MNPTGRPNNIILINREILSFIHEFVLSVETFRRFKIICDPAPSLDPVKTSSIMGYHIV